MPMSLTSGSVETTMPRPGTTGAPAPSYRQLAGKGRSVAAGSGSAPTHPARSARGPTDGKRAVGSTASDRDAGGPEHEVARGPRPVVEPV